MSGSGGELVGVVLAAGMGTRMKSSRPKVLHEVAGRSMLDWVLDALDEAGCERQFVVVGHAADEVRRHCAGRDVTWVEQNEQLGTGHALAQVEPAAVDGDLAAATLLVVSGDVPLVSASTLARLAAAASDSWGSMAVSRLDRPGSLGRVRTHDGALERIVEAADATPEELAIDLVNAGLYALPAPQVFDYLRQVGTNNAKGEIYLTDALGGAAADGSRIELVELEDPFEAQGVNDRRELAIVAQRMNARHLDALAVSGVTILDPARTVIEPTVSIGVDSVVHPNVNLGGSTVVGAGCVLHQGLWARDSRIDDEVTLEPYCVLQGVHVRSGASIGPFARLRPGADIGAGAKVGNFVEIKNSRLEAGAKAGHLAYLGDAVVGEGANIGAGTVTCNYDGQSKYPTEIGRGAFIGSDTMLVAPVTVGDGATTGAGSVITRDVPDGALAVERAEQRTVPNWKKRRRKSD